MPTETIQTGFGHDRPLLYTVSPWKELGFAVPNWGDNAGTLSAPIHRLADEIGRLQVLVMAHIDAQRTQPPSPNTVARLMKMLNRVSSILGTRQRDYTTLRVEANHSQPAIRHWIIHPVPYFRSGVVRNGWLSEYNELCMIALTNVYQHSDNNLALTVTEEFAKDIWVYFREIQHWLGIELLGLPAATVKADDFVFDVEAALSGYNPTERTINFESLDTPGPIEALWTEDDIRPLFRGFPAPMLFSHVGQYAVGKDGVFSAGSEIAAHQAAFGTVDDKFVGEPGPTIGEPTI